MLNTQNKFIAIPNYNEKWHRNIKKEEKDNKYIYRVPYQKNKIQNFKRSTIFSKLCMVIELVETIKNGAVHVSIQRIVSYRVHGKIRPNWLMRGFSSITP